MLTKFSKNRTGQAAIELALSLPFVVWLLFYTFNAFYTLHTAHIAQKYAAMSLYERIAYRSKYVVDDVANVLHGKEYMAVQYEDVNGRLPERKIIAGPSEVNNTVGICREPACQ
jgi:hypothetical protein